MEKIRRVKPIQYIMLCDECGNGEMMPTGVVLTSFPEQYQHVCNECGCVKTYNKQYPFIEYVADDFNYASEDYVWIMMNR